MLYLSLLIFFFSLLQADNSTNNNITFIGIGRLGLCTALCFEKSGYNVFGVDINPSYVDAINNKKLNSPEPLVNEYLKNSSNFRAPSIVILLKNGVFSSNAANPKMRQDSTTVAAIFTG